MRSPVIVLDPGHGGEDPGAVGACGVYEKDIALEIARVAADWLKANGWEVYLTRETDKHVSLYERARLSNEEGADVFVSIHLNAAENPAARGFEVYHYPGSHDGAVLASLIASRLRKLKNYYPGFLWRGIKTADFYVLKHTIAPAVLVECGFLTNPEECKWLKHPTNQERIGILIAEAIEDYFRQKGGE